MRAAIYARKSTDQSDMDHDATSVARQVAGAREYATKRGWVVAEEHIYVDEGISGAEFARRPGLVRLLSAVTDKGQFDVLIMAEESRLGRELIEVSYTLKQIISSG